MKTLKQAPRNNVIQIIVRQVLKEELADTENRLTQELNYRMDQRFIAFEDKIEEKLTMFRNEIMTGIDQITGMFKKHDEEHDILSGQHKRLINVEEKVEVLEKIHPQGRHLAV